MPADYDYIASEHRLDYGRKLTVWAQDHLANRYTDRTHFIFELLQNAEDALAERGETSLPNSVSFDLKTHGLEVRHFGKPFTPENVKSICAINESTKKGELTEIGRFGIGFKSVYAFTKRPEVHSGDEHFVIEDFVLPLGTPPRSTAPTETLFWIPFFENDDSAVQEISEALRNCGGRKLLFLRNVNEVSWSLPDGSSGVFLKNPPIASEEGDYVTLLGEVSGQLLGVEEKWLLFSRSVSTSEGKPAGRVEIAFLLGRDDKGQDLIREAQDSKLVVFFPTEVSTGAGFLLQGPYRTTPSRDTVPPNDPWNRLLVEETGDLLMNSLEALRQKNMLNVEALSVLPIDVRNYPHGSMFRPIFERVREALKTKSLLPAFGGGHVSGMRSRLARSEALRQLLSPSQLAGLLNSESELEWLSDEITKDRAAILREFLRQQVGVEEIVPDFLQSALTQQFLEAQPDEWMSRLYEFLSGQKAVLRELLRKGTPFIRCEDGTHVPPKRGEQPQAFLPTDRRTGFRIVKRAVCNSPSVVEFLKSVGLGEPDPVDEVVQNVLCRYSKENSGQTNGDYEADLQQILLAFSTDSDQGRNKLIDALRQAYFIQAVNLETRQVRFLKPSQVYRATQRLKTVFDGVQGVYLVDDRVANLRGESMRNLLQACGALDVLRTIPGADELSQGEKKALRTRQGHDVHTWDRVSDETDSADVVNLIRILPSLEEDAAAERSSEFWLLLRDTLRERREAYFQARYDWSYSQRSWTCQFPAAWVRRLKQSPWIADAHGKLKAPEQICFSETHDSIRDAPHPFLVEILGFRPEAIKQLAEQEGIDLEALNLLKRHNVSAEQLRKLLGEQEESPAVPGSIVDEEAQADNPSSDGSTGDEEEDGEEHQEPRTENQPTNNWPRDTPRHGSGLTSQGSARKSQSSPRSQFHTYVGANPTAEIDDDEDLTEDERRRIEAAAITYILAVEPTLQSTPTNNPGFDLFEGEGIEVPVRFVEVKAKRNAWAGPVALSDEQFQLANNERERYWLYVVEFAEEPEKRRVHRIQDPAGNARYFTYDPGWKNLAAPTQ